MRWNTPGLSINWKTCQDIIVGICLIYGLGTNYRQLGAQEMHRLTSIWVIQAIPAVLNPAFDQPFDYSALVGVRDRLEAITNGTSTRSLNTAIKSVLRDRPIALDRTSYRPSGDDKGIFDLVRLSFFIFGHKTERIVVCYWGILAVSSLCFSMRYWGQLWALGLLLAFLLAHSAVLPCVALNPQLRSVLAPRFLCVLGFVPAMHMLLEVSLGGRLGAVNGLLLAFQSILLVFVYHMRSSAALQSVVILLCFFVVAIKWSLIRNVVGTGAMAGRSLIPGTLALLFLLGGHAALKIHKRASYSHLYIREGGASHVFWHILYSGLAYHPELSRDYRLRIDDESIIAATGRFMTSQGRAEEWEAMGGTDDPHTAPLHYDLYDCAVRDMFCDTCWKRPWEVIATIAYYKPVALSEYVAWHCRLIEKAPRVEVLWEGAAEELDEMAIRMDREKKFFKLWRWDYVAILTVFACCGGASISKRWRLLLITFILIVLFSIPSSLVGYPSAHTLGEVLVGCGMIVYVCGVLLVSSGVGWLCTKRDLPGAVFSQAMCATRFWVGCVGRK